MAIGLGDIYEKLKELITVVEKVRENTEEIKELKKSQDKMRGIYSNLWKASSAFWKDWSIKKNSLH